MLTSVRRSRTWPLIIGVLLAATLLRTLPLLDNRFHPDEALYASFARRIASGHDPLLAGVLVDKPPAAFYLTALSLRLIHNGELGARLPALYASVVSVALVFVLARRLYTPATALLAAALLALSPFAVLFSVTVFLDPLLTAVVLLALVAGAQAQWRHLGVALGLAFTIKQTALLFVPLALGLALRQLPARATIGRTLLWLRPAMRWSGAALVAATLALVAWDSTRQAPIGFWRQGYSDNVPGRFIRANEVVPRALAWINLLHYSTASTALNLLAVAGTLGLLAAGARRPSRAALADALLAGYVLVYLAAYWLLAFNVWDRYLVPLLPLLAVLGARALHWITLATLRAASGWRRQHRGGPALAVLAALALAPGAAIAARSGYPIGGDHGAYDGIDDAAVFLSMLPAGSVLYDHWLSWQWGFYLFDAPVYVAWMPSPSALATDLQAFGHDSTRYFVVPSWEADGELRAAAAGAGFDFVPRHFSYRRDGSLSLTIYELAPLAPQPAAFGRESH